MRRGHYLVAALVACAVAASSAAAANEPPRSESGLRTDMWTPPAAPAGELSLYVAAQSWETAYGGRDPNFTVGLTGGLNLLSWLQIEGIADFSRRRETPANLRLTNTATFLGVGPSVGVWLGNFRLHADAAGGGLMRTLAFNDGAEAKSSDVRFAPAWQVGGGVGLGLFGHFGFGFNTYGRFHDDRANVLFVLEASWFPGAD